VRHLAAHAALDLVDRLRHQRTADLRRVHVAPGAALNRMRPRPTGRGEDDSVEGEIAVVISETKGDPIAPDQCLVSPHGHVVNLAGGWWFATRIGARLDCLPSRSADLAPPDVLYEEPENSFVAQFIGENNTLSGVVETIDANTCTVKLDSGEIIDAKPVNVSAAGDRTLVSIRPERVEFNKDRLQAGAHTLHAEVLEFIYMGDIFRTRLRVAGRDDFVVKTRNAPDQVRLQPGQQIEIGWLPEDCRALDA